jgi:transposase
MSGSEWLSDAAWAAIKPHWPEGRPGAPRVHDRRVISGILYVLRSGCRSSGDRLAGYGLPITIYNRWSAQGVWRRLLERLAAAGNVPDEISIDSTSKRTAPHPGPTREAKGRRLMGHSVSAVTAPFLREDGVAER